MKDLHGKDRWDNDGLDEPNKNDGIKYIGSVDALYRYEWPGRR